jgi:hypothetical protein
VTPRVVVVSGHMVDTPDRPHPRFPPSQVGRVTAEARVALDEWGVGPQTTVVTGAARGADIIVAEEGLARGARVVVCLALPREEFEPRSVALPDSDWVPRFRALLASADVKVLADEVGGGAGGDAVFARTNAWMVDLARSLGGGRPHAVVVWNGQEGDGPGGTRDFVSRLGYDRPAPTIRVIDPTPRAYEARQGGVGPKKLLALDGGGMRGALSLEILRSIEAGLRTRYGGDLVLADYFDYIGGTSTGAIIASALAFGMPVDELQQKYRTLGAKVFTRRFLPLRLRSIYRDGPLTRELNGVLGPGRTLGDPQLRSLLLVVLHNIVTDSPWPLTSCTRAKYNRADRYLNSPSDRNLDLSLVELIRGSTAAPIYFPPQRIPVGKQEFLFQDGGTTPFNNPALLMFLMATLPEYRLGWPVGEDRLLVVSVGTGSSAAVHPGLLARQVNLVFNATNLPSVFMNGAAVSQDLLCRSLGRCRFGRVLDSEFGARLDALGVAGRNLFTYLRYDVDLSDDALREFGIQDGQERNQLRKLDAVRSVPRLEELGRAVGEKIDLDTHFAGFL